MIPGNNNNNNDLQNFGPQPNIPILIAGLQELPKISNLPALRQGVEMTRALERVLAELAEMRRETQQLRGEVKQVSGEVKQVSEEVKQVRQEMNHNIQQVREEMNHNIQGVHAAVQGVVTRIDQKEIKFVSSISSQNFHSHY